MTPGEFAEIEARAAAATEGPWIAEYSGEQGNCVIPHDAKSTREAVCVTRLYHQHADAEFIAHSRTDVETLLAAVRERDDTIARVREVCLLGLDEIAQKSIDATVARMQDQLGCTPDDLGPDVMAKIVDSYIEQAELFAGPVLDALRAALDPQETP